MRGAGARHLLPPRLLPTLAVGVTLLLVVLLWTGGAHAAYFALFRLLGVPAFRFPFLDTHAELAVLDCHRLGLDVYQTNPCDVLGRMHVYTPLWYRLDWTGLTRSDTPAVGLALAVLFAASLALLPPCRTGRATWLLVLAALSPAVAFGLERGNADLLMFALAALAGWLAVRTGPARLVAYPLVVLAAALKLYPATLLVLALRERSWRCVAAGGVSLAALAAYFAFDRAGLREMLTVVPTGSPFIYAFGARDLALGIALGFRWPSVALAAIQAAGLLTVLLFALARQPMLRPAVAALTDAETVGLMIGAVLIGGCFVLGQSGEYRAVHLLFTLPALIALAGVSGPARGLARGTLCVVLAQLWGDLASGVLDVTAGIAPGDVAASALARLLWFTRELAWWWVVAVLLGLLLAVAHRLPAFGRAPAAG
jgi:hypothetical protein